MTLRFMERAIFPAKVEVDLKDEFFGGARDGFFVDVGANEPEDGSQTWHLEVLGWRGVLDRTAAPVGAKTKRTAKRRSIRLRLLVAAECRKNAAVSGRRYLFVAQPQFFCA